MSVQSPTVAVIIAAAGNSTRMGEGIDKQFVLIGGRPLLWHSIQLFNSLPGLSRLLVTVSQSNEKRVSSLLRETVRNVPWQIVRGGSERQHSVRNALCLVDEASDLVLVHDGARPFVTMETVLQSIAAAAEHGAAVVAVPVKDTIKISDENGYAAVTPDRTSLWQIQTPQAFRYDLVLRAYTRLMESESFQKGVTDDAMVVETMTEEKVKLIQGDYTNIKVTTPMDVKLAEVIYDEISSSRRR